MEYITYPNEYYIRDNYNAPASPSVLMFGEDDEKAIRMKVFPEIGLKLKKVDLSEYAKQFQSNE